MPFEILCNQCGVTLRLQESQIGLIINCPSCGQVIFVQEPAAPVTGPATSPPSPDAQATIALQSSFNPEPTATARPSSDAQATVALQSTPAEPDLATLLQSAAKPEGQQSATDLDLGSSLAELLGGEEKSSIFASDESADAPFAPVQDLEPVAFEPAGQTAEPPAAPATQPPPIVFAPADSPVAAAAERPDSSAVAPAAPQISPTAATPAGFELPDFFESGAKAEPALVSLPPSSSLSDALSSSMKPAKVRSNRGALIGAYASGVILGLILGLIVGKLMFGGRAGYSATGLEMIRDDGANKHKTQWISPNTPVPRAQRGGLGETIELGDLAVTAIKVERGKVSLERVDPGSGSKETTTSPDECLILRVRFKNTSSDIEFAPLDETFLRPHDPRQRPTYSFIERRDGRKISMYGLAQFSEWNIVGQSFDVLKPGQEIEAVIAADPGSPAKANGRMVWRLQVRAGGIRDKKSDKKSKDASYSTVVGFEFTPEEIRG